MPVRGVLFDMGGTLLHYSAPGANWEDTEKIGASGVYACCKKPVMACRPASRH